MRVLIDACVLFPTVLREIVLGVAATGAFTPLWSERILEEWRRAAARVDGSPIAEAEIAALRAVLPGAEVQVEPGTEARLSLPDPDDVHVLAAAIDAKADAILTLNLRDFPARALAREGLLPRHPDPFLLELFHTDNNNVRGVVNAVLARASGHGIDTSNPRTILKRARLPRLAKALYAS